MISFFLYLPVNLGLHGTSWAWVRQSYNSVQADGTKEATWETGNLGKENSVGPTAQASAWSLPLRTQDFQGLKKIKSWMNSNQCFDVPQHARTQNRVLASAFELWRRQWWVWSNRRDWKIVQLLDDSKGGVQSSNINNCSSNITAYCRHLWAAFSVTSTVDTTVDQ